MEKADYDIQYRANKKYPNCLVKYPDDDIPFNERQSRIRMGYINGAREQKQIDDARIEAIRQSLIERQGEYISLELIEEIFTK